MRKYSNFTNTFLIILLTALLVLLTAAGSYAADYNIDDSYYDDDEQKVYDYADILTDSEENSIQSSIVRAAKDVKLDIIVVTIDDNEGKDAEQYAADFYDDHSFGYDCECGSGVLMLIDMDSRTVAVSTAGMARIYIDRRIDELLDDEIMPYMERADYAGVAGAFIDAVQEYGEDALDDGDYEEAYEEWYSSDHSDAAVQNKFYEKYKDAGEDTFFTIFRNPLISGLIALIAAGIAVAVMSASSRTPVTVGGLTYMDAGSLQIPVHRDMFTHTTTTRRKIEHDDNGGHGGGSRTTISSSGHSHGGGSRKF